MLSRLFRNMRIPANLLEQVGARMTKVEQERVALQQKKATVAARELQEVHTALDRLYEDKLFGRITQEMYEKFHKNLQDRARRTKEQQEHSQSQPYQAAITTSYLLDLASRSGELFMRSSLEAKRALVNLVLLNLKINAESIVWDVREPFNTLLKIDDRQIWCAR